MDNPKRTMASRYEKRGNYCWPCDCRAWRLAKKKAPQISECASCKSDNVRFFSAIPMAGGIRYTYTCLVCKNKTQKITKSWKKEIVNELQKLLKR